MRAEDSVIAVRVIRHDEATGLSQIEDQDAPEKGEIVWCIADGGRPPLPARGFAVERFDAFKFAMVDAGELR